MHKGSGHPRAAPPFCGSTEPSMGAQAAPDSPAAEAGMHQAPAHRCHGSGEPAPKTTETLLRNDGTTNGQ